MRPPRREADDAAWGHPITEEVEWKTILIGVGDESRGPLGPSRNQQFALPFHQQLGMTRRQTDREACKKNP